MFKRETAVLKGDDTGFGEHYLSVIADIGGYSKENRETIKKWFQGSSSDSKKKKWVPRNDLSLWNYTRNMDEKYYVKIIKKQIQEPSKWNLGKMKKWLYNTRCKSTKKIRVFF